MNYAIILAGGVGSRFWPLSRLTLPKQFIAIKGHSSFLQNTIKRIRPVIKDKNIFFVTSRSWLPIIRRQIKGFAIPDANIILEPKPINTAPCIGFCAQSIYAKDKDALLVILPSDHFIKNKSRFDKDIRRAISVAKSGYLVTLGVKPSRPHTGYGYIATGSALSNQAFKVISFIEKPTFNKAKKIFQKKNIFWNAGIFCWKADVFLNELQKHSPNLHRQIIKINNRADMLRTWRKVEPISVDYAVLEKSKKLALVPAKFDWTDLGSWDALCDILPKDKADNIILTKNFNLASRGLIVFSKTKKFIATIGLKNLIIVDTPDALLVCSRHNDQEVKTLFECLKKRRKEVC